MTPFDYQQLAQRTEATYAYEGLKVYCENMGLKLDPDSNMDAAALIRLRHAADGLTTETGELVDSLKKWCFYGKNLDHDNLIEELGDILWYVALACNALNATMERVMEKNIAKLRARYPDKFTSENAINRDLEAEKKALNSGPVGGVNED